MIKISKNFKYLLFVGCGRTGSSLVGQLLNCHPGILITNEMRILQNSIKNHTCVKDSLYHLIEEALRQATHGTKQYDIPLKTEHKQKWQQDWVDTSQLDIPDKNNIVYLGDKKQGGNTTMLLNHAQETTRALRDLNYIPITVIRHPHNVLKSYIRLNNDILNSSVTVLRDMNAGYDYTVRHKGIVVNYDSIIEWPRQWCFKMYEQLNLTKCNKWEDIVQKAVNTNKQCETLTDDELEYFQTCKGYNELMSKMATEGIC